MSGFRDFDDDDELGRTKLTLQADALGDAGARRGRLTVLIGAEVGRLFPLEQAETVIGRSANATITLDDDSVSRMHCTVVRVGPDYMVEDRGSSNGTYLNGERVERARLKDGDKIRVGETTVLRFGFGDGLDDQFARQLYDAALRDSLTGAFNKRYLLDTLAKEVRFAARHRTNLVLIMFDLDHFKRVNDTYGHLAGDQVLAHLGRLALGVLRTEDVFARYGGEEFGIVARSISLEQGGHLAERLRSRVESSLFPIGGDQHLRVTLSLGVCLWRPEFVEATQLIAAADEALYAAKRGGRNRFVLYGA
ncbi:MAG: diguanylate cyclase [Deltaproteobacteria bacterium]|nr:diguanylate cyclase [Deltaproteobacteria bacterium]